MLQMNEGIHIQEIDFWIVDVSTMNHHSIQVYKNRQQYSNILFVINGLEQMKICLDNGFSHFLKLNFLPDELRFWCNFFFQQTQNNIHIIDSFSLIDFEENHIIQDEKIIKLTPQELCLLKVLSSKQFIPTSHLTSILKVNSPISVRTIINRIRKKITYDIFEQKNHLGYRLKHMELKQEGSELSNEEHINYLELKEQNRLIQKIIDSSSIYIVSFIHRQLYCINESFRNYLGNECIKEIWDEEKGDFFQLIVHQFKDYEKVKKELFTRGSHLVQIFNLEKEKNENFTVKTFYFPNMDKHLLIFYPLN